MALFYENLDKIVYERYKIVKCDEIAIISGYVGPEPIAKISNLPLHSTIIYGMYGSDRIGKPLHKALVSAEKSYSNIDIYYSTIPIHSKIYMWIYKGEVVHALIGSANFSTNGLTTPFKETLAETTADTFPLLDNYYSKVIKHCLICTDSSILLKSGKEYKGEESYDPNICSLPLYILKNDKPIVPDRSGLNWGMAKLTGSHVNINDSYIPIPSDMAEHYTNLFPVKRTSPTDPSKAPRADHRDNDNIDIIWDDGTTMTGLMEGSRVNIIDGNRVEFPKQIASSPHKSILGKYLRNRLNVPEGKAIQLSDLERYGRKTIDISLLGEGVYYFDFSV